MSCCDDDDAAWLDERIAAKKALIIELEAAIDKLASGAQMYQLDTGQSRQLVQKAQLSQLRNQLSELENDVAVLQARKCGTGAYGRPTF